MLRFILWSLIFWFVLKAVQALLIKRQTHKRQTSQKQQADSQTPFNHVEEAEFEDITSKTRETRPGD